MSYKGGRYSGYQRTISKMGVSPSNCSLGDISGDFIRKTYIATCDSDECRISASAGAFAKIRKHVAKNVNKCPDCGNALFWKEDKE